MKQFKDYLEEVKVSSDDIDKLVSLLSDDMLTDERLIKLQEVLSAMPGKNYTSKIKTLLKDKEDKYLVHTALEVLE